MRSAAVAERVTPGVRHKTEKERCRLYPLRIFTTGIHIDGTHWLPNKEMTKLWEVSDETSTDRFPHFQCLTLQCDTSTLSLRPGGRVGSPRGRGRSARGSVDLRGQPRGRRGGRTNRFCDLGILVRSMDCQMYRRADRHSKAQLGWRVTWRVKASVVLLIMSSSMIGWNLYPLTQLKTGSGGAG